MTMAVIFQAIAITVKLGAGRMTPDELAKRFRMIYIRSRHRRAFPERRGRLPLMEAITFAIEEEGADGLRWTWVLTSFLSRSSFSGLPEL